MFGEPIGHLPGPHVNAVAEEVIGRVEEPVYRLDRIGRLDEEVAFHPYWDNADTIRTQHRDTYASYYQRPEQTLVFVGNRGKQEARDQVTLKTGERYSRAIDAVTGESIGVSRSRFSLTVPAELYRAVFLAR